jgi:DNA-binding NarL/FixJ family response regulator
VTCTGLAHPRRAGTLYEMASVEVLIVHHEEESRRAARAVVTATPAFEAVGEAATAEEALELAVALRPQLALIATGMPGIDGFEAGRRLKAAVPSATVVLLYSASEPDAAALAAAGASAAVHLDELAPASLQAFGRSPQGQ